METVVVVVIRAHVQDQRCKVRESADVVEDIPRVSSKEAIDFMGAERLLEEADKATEKKALLNTIVRTNNPPLFILLVPRLSHGTFTSRCRHNVLSLPWLPIKERTLGASGDDNNTMLINQYNVSELPPRNEASFYNSSDSPGPPFSSNQMNSMDIEERRT